MSPFSHRSSRPWFPPGALPFLLALGLLLGGRPTPLRAGLRRGDFSLGSYPAQKQGLVRDGEGGFRLAPGARRGSAWLVLHDLPEHLQSLRLKGAWTPGWRFTLARAGQQTRDLPPEGSWQGGWLGRGEGPLYLGLHAERLSEEPGFPEPVLGELLLEARWATREAPPSPVPGSPGDPVLPAPRAWEAGPVETPDPQVVTRAQWGALAPKEPYDRHDPVAIVIHHSWLPTANQYARTGGAESVAGIQRFHMYDRYRMWNDTGYHFLIGPDGNIFEARPPHAIGAHAVPNTGKLGICMIGNYDPGGDPVTPEAWASLEDLVSSLALRFDIPMDQLYGHRAFSHKTCPGDMVHDRFPALRQEVYRRLGSMGVEEDFRLP